MNQPIRKLAVIYDIASRRVRGSFTYHTSGLCSVCQKTNEPIIIFEDEAGIPNIALCSSCCQVIMAMFGKEES